MLVGWFVQLAADAMRREQEIDPAYQKSLEDMADGANGELELARLTLNNLHLRQMPQIKQDENAKMMLAPPTAITIKPSSQQGKRDPRLAGRRGSVTNVAGRRGSVSTVAAGRRGSVAKAGASEQKYRVKVPALGLTDSSTLLAPPAPGSLAEKVSVGASVFEYTLSERAFLSGFDEGAGRFGTELDEEAANALLSEQDDAFGTLDDLAYLQDDSLVGGLIEDINSHIFTSTAPDMMPGFVPSPTNLSKTTSPVNVVVKSQVSPTYSTASLNVPAYRAQAAASPSNAQQVPAVISPTASKTVTGAFGGFSASAAIAAATEHVGIDTNLGGDEWLDTDLDAHTAAQVWAFFRIAKFLKFHLYFNSQYVFCSWNANDNCVKSETLVRRRVWLNWHKKKQKGSADVAKKRRNVNDWPTNWPPHRFVFIVYVLFYFDLI
jgi:hypothetical protein